MFKKITAIAAAASCAGLIVAFAPGFAPEVVAGTSQPDEASMTSVAAVAQPAELVTPSAAEIRKAVEQNLRNGSHHPKVICERHWPYYERSCLRDDHPSAGTARVVRVIATDRAAAAAAAEAARDTLRKVAEATVQITARPAATRAVRAKR